MNKLKYNDVISFSIQSRDQLVEDISRIWKMRSAFFVYEDDIVKMLYHQKLDILKIPARKTTVGKDVYFYFKMSIRDPEKTGEIPGPKIIIYDYKGFDYYGDNPPL